jgi:hypothetical protein
MNVSIKIEGDSREVRDLITHIRTNPRYVRYSYAKYSFTPDKDTVEFVFENHAGGGAVWSELQSSS